jgi:hypothetical protein
MTRQQLTRGMAAVVVILGGIALTNASRHAERNQFCADVGLMTDTYGATPREALVAYVRSRGGDPKYWQMSGTASFEAKNEKATPKGLASIGASETAPNVWRAVGGCVGNYGSQPPRTGYLGPPNRNTCGPSGLRVSVTEGPARAPFATWQFALENVSDETCEVAGYPSVRLNQNAYPLSFDFLRRSGVLVAAPKPTAVRLAPGRSAYFVLEKDACTPNDSIVAATADVYVGMGDATSHTSMPLPGRFALCGPNSYSDDPVLQTAIVSAPSAAYLPTPAPQRCRARDLEAQDAGATRAVDTAAAWVVRLRNTGATPCDLRGLPTLSIGGPGGQLLGIGAKRTTTEGRLIRGGPRTTVTVAPGGAAYIAFEKLACTQAEQPITTIGFSPPANRSSLIMPIPEGLEKCDFKEPAGNVVWFGPFFANAADALTT